MPLFLAPGYHAIVEVEAAGATLLLPNLEPRRQATHVKAGGLRCGRPRSWPGATGGGVSTAPKERLFWGALGLGSRGRMGRRWRGTEQNASAGDRAGAGGDGHGQRRARERPPKLGRTRPAPPTGRAPGGEPRRGRAAGALLGHQRLVGG